MASAEKMRIGDQAAVFRELLDNSWIGVAIFNEDARLIFSNNALRHLNPDLEEMFATDLDWDQLLIEWAARGLIDVKTQNSLRQLERRLADRALASERTVVEMRDHGLHEILLVSTASGGFAMAQRDVTSNEITDDQDREADAILRQVMEACPANLVMSRMDDGQIIYRSPAAREVLGSGKKVLEHFVERADLADFVTALLPEGRIDDVFVNLRDTENNVFPALVSSRLIEYRGEDVAVSSLTDITKEVEMRKMLAAQRERIFETEKMSALGELLAGVAHELNNPLSVVVGHSLMLREETDDPDILRRVEQIEHAAERCAKIVKSFLAMAREQKVEKQVLGLPRLLDDALASLAEGGSDFRLEVERDLPADLPEVRGDAAQLEQVFTNLLMNAQQAIAKAQDGGKIVVAAVPDARRKLVVIDVQDDGPGIPPRIGKRVFEPLFTTKEVGQGTGIGLAFCHRVLTAHGGSIELMPSERGAHFRIHLPMADEMGSSTEAAGGPLPDSERGCVLVIDDEQDVAALISEILRRDGFSVQTAYSGEDGLAAVDSREFDAILVDIKMPGIGGQGFLAGLQANRPELVERVAFVTGSTMSPDTRGFIDNSGCRFLEKPVAPKDLRALAREIAGGHGA